MQAGALLFSRINLALNSTGRGHAKTVRVSKACVLRDWTNHWFSDCRVVRISSHLLKKLDSNTATTSSLGVLGANEADAVCTGMVSIPITDCSMIMSLAEIIGMCSTRYLDRVASRKLKPCLLPAQRSGIILRYQFQLHYLFIPCSILHQSLHNSRRCRGTHFEYLL